MKVGDLVRYKDPAGRWSHWKGIIVRCIAGTDKRKVVAWANEGGASTNGVVSYPVTQLEVISESR